MSTRAMAARAATTMRCRFMKRLTSRSSPIEIAKRPTRRGPETRDGRNAESRHCQDRDGGQAGVRDQGQVEHDQGAGQRCDEWMYRSKAHPVLQDTTQAE